MSASLFGGFLCQSNKAAGARPQKCPARLVAENEEVLYYYYRIIVKCKTTITARLTPSRGAIWTPY